MRRRGLALVALAIVGCHDAPARTKPRPTAPAQASRALLEQALTVAVADATKAETLIPPPPPPAPVLSDDPPQVTSLLGSDPDALNSLLGALSDDPDAIGGLGSALGGVGVAGGQVGGVTGLGQLGHAPPPLPSAVTVQLLADSDGLDGTKLAQLTLMLRASARLCVGEASIDAPITDPISALVTLAATPGTGVVTVDVRRAGPLTCCTRWSAAGWSPTPSSPRSWSARSRPWRCTRRRASCPPSSSAARSRWWSTATARSSRC